MVRTTLSSPSSSLPFVTPPQPPHFQYHNNLHPLIYVAPYSHTSIEINADVDKAAWAQIPWSSEFDDIRGPNNGNGNDNDDNDNRHPSQKCRTRFKMQWDDEYLYVLALLHSDMEVPATFTERNSPIYHQDSDFEVFADPMGSCHFYKELEMNAINTVWNLMLDKPYEDGGHERSGRIAGPGEPDYYEVERLGTAARVIEGELNRPGNSTQDHDGGVVWAVEIALAHTDTLRYQTQQILPQVGGRWRINFSRVEKKGDINWTWQQQRIWDPIKMEHVGKVNMHLPDAWGYVQFGSTVEECDECRIGQVPLEEILLEGKGDPLWPARLTVSNVYYAQRRYREVHGAFASDLTYLTEFTDAKIIAPFADTYEMNLTPAEDNDEDGYIFTIHSEGSVVSVTNNRLIKVRDSITTISEQVIS